MAVPLNVTVGNEAPLKVQLEVDETSGSYAVNPVVVDTVAGQPLHNVEVATLSGPANGSYSASIDWGDGDPTSPGVIAALGGGQFIVTGSKPNPYSSTKPETVTVTVTDPGTTPAPAPLSTVTDSHISNTRFSHRV